MKVFLHQMNGLGPKSIAKTDGGDPKRSALTKQALLNVWLCFSSEYLRAPIHPKSLHPFHHLLPYTSRPVQGALQYS